MAVGEAVLLNWVLSNEPPAGVDTTTHTPTPTVGVFAASVNPPLQLFWSGPAFEVVGLPVRAITTSSVEFVHGALLIVQRSV